MATRTPPKRTRRVTMPFDDRLEVRCYKAEKAHLAAEASRRGMTVGDLIRFQLGDLLGPKPVQPVQAPDQDGEGPQNGADEPTGATVSLIGPLSAAFGIRPGVAVLKIRTGKVEVGGEPWTHTEIPAELLPHVMLDGEPLPLRD